MTVQFTPDGAHSNHTLQSEYSSTAPAKLLAEPDTFAVFTFNGTSAPSKDTRLIHTGLELLSKNKESCEVWRSTKPISHGQDQGVNWSQTDSFLLCAISINETPSENIEKASLAAYHTLLNFIQEKGFPHILRAWNYFSEINLGAGDSERYRLFCSGRYEAFEQNTAEGHTVSYPSACALGHFSDNGVVYLLTSKEPGTHFENPAQQSAYSYPRVYGPKSPSFSRATLAKGDSGTYVFVSGTASIIGSDTIAVGDTMAQLDVTLDNIDKLLAHIQQKSKLAERPYMQSIKVYIRHEKDMAAIRPKVDAHFNKAQILYIHADICRSDLELEIDGTCFVTEGDEHV